MISYLTGKILAKDLDRVEMLTASGLGYEVSIPLGVFESLPRVGEEISLYTHLVVREDGWQLFGFGSPFERQVFRRVLDAKGVGPALALGLLSSLSAERLVRAIRERDIATLQRAPRVGRKKAEQLILDLADKLDAIGGGQPLATAAGAAATDAMRALILLGYAPQQAERAVRAAVDADGDALAAPELIRRALEHTGGKDR